MTRLGVLESNESVVNRKRSATEKTTDYVFVCYVRQEEDFVLELATNLKNLGISVWLDQ